jgi:hypothetical protein
MVNRGANIDMVFRNGLKDYEVLPPAEVINSILPLIKQEPKSFIFLKSAAMIVVLVSLGFLTYLLTRDVSSGFNDSEMAFIIEASSPVTSHTIERSQNIISKKTSFVRNSSESKIEILPERVIESENEIITSQEIPFLYKPRTLSLSNAKLQRGIFSSSTSTPQNSVFTLKSTDPVYQIENPPANGNEKWSIAAMASPTYYSRFNAGNDAVSKQLMSTEQALISYTGGVAFSYKVNKRFSIQAGLSYSSLAQSIDGVNSYTGFQKYNDSKGSSAFRVLTSNGTIYTRNSDVFITAGSGMPQRVVTSYTRDVFDPKQANLQFVSSDIHQNFSYLELPVMLRYKIIDKKVDVNLIGGMSYNMLVGNSVYTMVDGSKYDVGETAGLNKMTVSSSLGMGMEYSLSEKLSFNLEPTFRYYLNPFNGTTSSSVHPYSFGVLSGVSYRF